MKKELKSDVCGSVNSAWLYCSQLKSQQNRLLKKKKKAENANVKHKSRIQTKPPPTATITTTSSRRVWFVF